MFGYNGQIAVDSEHQIIVAADIHDNATDSGALPALLDSVEKELGGLTDCEVMADMGYKSHENFEAIEAKNAKAFIPFDSNGEGDFPEHFAEQVIFDENSDRY